MSSIVGGTRSTRPEDLDLTDGESLAELQRVVDAALGLTTETQAGDAPIDQSEPPARHHAHQHRYNVSASGGLPTEGEPDGGGTLHYRGFKVDVSALAGRADRTSLIGHIEKQLDIIRSVGLPPSALAFCRKVPMKVDAQTLDATNGTPGLYSGLADQVSIRPAGLKDGEPILLHELMHAFHHDQLPNGFGNQTVLGFYQQAKDEHLFPVSSYMLSNPKEYFAMVSTAYLFGTLDRPPTSRENLVARQPEVAAWLGEVFGPH